MCACFRYLFIFIYPDRPDSGGKLYFSLLNITLVIMVISEITVLGLLGIKLSIVGALLMLPLLLVTVLFNIYVRQKHFFIAEHLPSSKSLEADLSREEEGFQTDFLLGVYTQPELKAEKEALPDNLLDPINDVDGVQDEEVP